MTEYVMLRKLVACDGKQTVWVPKQIRDCNVREDCPVKPARYAGRLGILYPFPMSLSSCRFARCCMIVCYATALHTIRRKM
jgi:hypothetical protein